MADDPLVLRPLGRSDAARVARFISGQPGDYARFFYAFGDDETALAVMLERARRDIYSGLFLGERLICIFMLRGWDAGFDIPSFGLVVDAQYRGQQVLTVALEAAKLSARLRGAARMMCKVHPDNPGATRGALRLGFIADVLEPESGNLIYYLDL